MHVIVVKGRIVLEPTSQDLQTQPELLQRYLGI